MIESRSTDHFESEYGSEKLQKNVTMIELRRYREWAWLIPKMNIESGSVHRDGCVKVSVAEGRLYAEAVVTSKGLPYLGFLGGGSARSRQIRNLGTYFQDNREDRAKIEQLKRQKTKKALKKRKRQLKN
jgi:hypothetical protein